MIFILLTLAAALALAAVAGWFSIIGVMAILAGAPIHALVAGVTIEAAKLVTTSWIYRNWNYASLKLRCLLMFFTALIMLVTSMGVFGFLSKAHLEQGASTVDNSAKVVRLEEQIAREKAAIADNEKIIAQLDETVQVLTDSRRISGSRGSIAVRKSQEEQRLQLRNDIESSQKTIDSLSEQRFGLQSEVRKLELEVGPIRYIAEVIYGSENNSTQHIESAVRIFILLLVLTLDPLAVTLLIAANNSIMRWKDEENKKNKPGGTEDSTDNQPETTTSENSSNANEPDIQTALTVSTEETNVLSEASIHEEIPPTSLETVNEEKETITSSSNSENENSGEGGIENPVHTSRSISQNAEPSATQEKTAPEVSSKDDGLVLDYPKQDMPLPIIRPPKPGRVADRFIDSTWVDWARQDPVQRELRGIKFPHFVPQKLDEGNSEKDELPVMIPAGSSNIVINNESLPLSHKYPNTFGWLTEFKRTQHE